MLIDKDLETKVEDVLQAKSVSKARQIIQSRSGITILAAISFVESSLPLPFLTDPLLVASILVNRANTARLVVVATAASVLGGLFAYFTAVLFFETLLQWMTPEMVSEFQTMLDTNGSSAFALTMVGAVTPVPYTIVAWVVAALKGGLVSFIAASILGRGLRYTIVGYSTYRFGPLAISYAKKYIGITSILVLVLAVLYIWLNV
ncbi:MAG: membrane protein YqaA with SNARE-associated domain [Candidatus Paceibacteria bacterium]|jgi:membrane protein YqaA with SNARE-associated domain